MFNKSLDHSSQIRCFAWHPMLNRCAIAFANDFIHVYSSQNTVPFNLKHRLQKNITSLIWKPCKESEILLVSCQSIIIIWTLDTTSNISNVFANCAQIIDSPLPSPLTSIDFDLNTDSLVVCSPRSSKIAIIKLTDFKNQKMIKRFNIGFTFLNYSPDKTRLAVGTTLNHLRVFETFSWTDGKWSSYDVEGICNTICWSHDGKILLYSLKDDSHVYAIAFYDKAKPGAVGGTQRPLEVLNCKEFQSTGGAIHDMKWDNSERLIIVFKDNPKLIALFKTNIKPNLEITPIGFIHGTYNEVPLLISFHQLFKSGSLLTVCWNSGVVSHIPLQYEVKNKANLNHTQLQTPRNLRNFSTRTPKLKNDENSFNVSRYNETLNGSSFFSPKLTPSRDSVVSPRRPKLFSHLKFSDITNNNE